MAALEITGLVKRYGDFTAVDGISLSVPEGEFFGLLGPNGAGKTTTINSIVGLSRITAGSIRLFGLDVERDWRPARRTVGLAPQEYNFDRYLNIRDILLYQAGYYGLSGPAIRRRAGGPQRNSISTIERRCEARARNPLARGYLASSLRV